MKRITTTCTLLAFVYAMPGARANPQSQVADTDVLDAIEREVLYDRVVPANRLDVEVASGIATLSGTVESMLAKERAARIAEAVKGVRSVVNLIEVTPSGSKSDSELEQDVSAALSRDPAADSYEVNAAAHDGLVVLSGKVESWKERDLCAIVAKGVDGVTDLTNEIQVSFVSQRPDVEIEQEVAMALRWDVLVDHGLIDVDVESGTVRLSGTVGSAAEKRHARLNAYVAGVKQVDASGLEVARWARDEDLRGSKYVYREPAEVERAIEAALALDPRVDSFQIDPAVSMGVVTLRGVVDNLKAKRAAEQDARHTVGVTSVHNHLKVRPVVERSNEAIAQGVRAALLHNPLVDRSRVGVSVHDGTVHLSGSVDSYFKKGEADDLAARVNGVTGVVNQLAVEDRPYSYDPYVDTWSVHSYPWYGPSMAYATFVSDWQIERAIEDELFWSPFVDADDVTVSVVDGVATLTGTVDSWMERGAALDNAFEGGAKNVNNRLEVVSERADS